MQIERLTVEEGFLAGLDLQFADGLNVLIGPRGAGKTSVIELLRFAAGAEAITEAAEVRSRRHALSVLRSGRVTLTVRDGDLRYQLTRTADDKGPVSDESLPTITILAQNEIERVGLQDTGRLRLIDEFTESTTDDREAGRLLAQIRTLTVEIKEINDDLDQLQDQARQLAKVPTELAAARKDEAQILQSSSASAHDQKRLKQLQSETALSALQASVLSRARSRIEEWAQRLSDLILTAPALEQWPDGAGSEDLLIGARSQLQKLVFAVSEIEESVHGVLADIRELESDIQERRRGADDAARGIRVRLERIQEGAGAISRRVQTLQEQASQLAALRSLRTERRSRLSDISGARDQFLTALEELRDERFRRRRQAAQRLTKSLSPRIRVRIKKAEVDRAYQDAITEALKGSGLHYTTLAPLIAESMSPRELALAVEGMDATALATATQLNRERATRVLAQIRAAGVSDLLTAPIQDGVELALLDGADYKVTTELSTGQRCTVVLPIVLSHHGTPVVIDQPEDHLDNAFIADTVITALRNRQPGDQLILSTHNANIPVLGEADCVVLMGSDGRRGFVRQTASLDDPRTVTAISTLMEGGAEAFAQRAAYYDSHSEQLRGSR